MDLKTKNKFSEIDDILKDLSYKIDRWGDHNKSNIERFTGLKLKTDNFIEETKNKFSNMDTAIQNHSYISNIQKSSQLDCEKEIKKISSDFSWQIINNSGRMKELEQNFEKLSSQKNDTLLTLMLTISNNLIHISENFSNFLKDFTCNQQKRSDTMPLVKGKAAKTRKGFGKNVKKEMAEGKPQKQAVAIAYSEARKVKKTKKKMKK